MGRRGLTVFEGATSRSAAPAKARAGAPTPQRLAQRALRARSVQRSLLGYVKPDPPGAAPTPIGELGTARVIKTRKRLLTLAAFAPALPSAGLYSEPAEAASLPGEPAAAWSVEGTSTWSVAPVA
jgi:hypothetical protein